MISKENVGGFVTVCVTITLCIVIVGMVGALLVGLFDSQIDNSKIFKFGNFPTNKESHTEKTLRESILNINTEENRNKFKVVNVAPNNYSESSVYYEHNNKVIEEYSNNLHMVKEENEDKDESEDKVPKQDKTYKYFSNLNI
jgi:FtsZ-interacting cell division protein ZipA